MLATVKDFQELSTGGFGWIQNLTDIDHFFIFPILFGLSNLAIMEVCMNIFLFLYLYINILTLI